MKYARDMELWYIMQFKSSEFHYTYSKNPPAKSPLLGAGCILYNIDSSGVYILVIRHDDNFGNGRKLELVFGGYSDNSDPSILHTASREVEEETAGFYSRSLILKTLQEDKGVKVIPNKLYFDDNAWYATILTPVYGERVSGDVIFKKGEKLFTRNPRAIIENPTLYWRECSGFEWRLALKEGSTRLEKGIEDADVHLKKQGLLDSVVFTFLKQQFEHFQSGSGEKERKQNNNE